MSKIFPLKGVIQNYAWGGTKYIPALLKKEVTDEKCAEYWLGAHDKAPSQLKTLKGDEALNDYLNKDLIASLGENITNKFGRLPFLFKVLDVHDMLSIQVHPTKVEAEKGFKHENELGIPLTASNRNYKDDNHKPEIMVALSEFWLLHGFQPKVKLKNMLTSVPEFAHLISVFEEGGYFGLYKEVMQESQEKTNSVLQPLVNRILPLYKEDILSKESPDYWAAKAFQQFCKDGVLDKGIYSIYFFNIVKVEKGEAVFQDAGIPHAYLEGQNMELMANSDNVLRGGLTPKYIDVPELLKHVTFEPTEPNILNGILQENGLERIYKSTAPDFELSQIQILNNDMYAHNATTAEILIVIEGHVTVKEETSEILLEKGGAIFIKYNSFYEITSSNNAIIYKATAP
ncbi:mannose-6-phosphate isomerase [Urechidicola sp. KH5]